MPAEHTIAAAGRDNVRVLLADDHPLVREAISLAIRRVAGWEVCGTAGDGLEAIAKAVELRPDVIVLDLNMPHVRGATAVRELKQLLPYTEIVIFSAAPADECAQELFDSGVKSFVCKTDDPLLLIAAIRAAAQHMPFLTPTVSEIILRRASNRDTARRAAVGQLTEREREILRHIADGRPNREIAATLGISSRTAEAHRATIMRKVHASSTAELVRFAIRGGIVEA